MRELQNLYGVLLEQNLISIDFNQFASKINDENYKEKVYNTIMEGDLYSGSYIDFQNKFIPTQAATTTPRTSSRRKPTKTEQPEQQGPTFVNEDFWKTQKYAREDYTYRDGKWYYKNPKTGKEVSISETTSNDTSQRLQELQKEREAEFNYKKSKLEVEQDILNQKEDKTDEDTQKQLELEKQLNLLNQESIVDENQKNIHKKKLGGLKMPEVTKDITERDDERAIKFLNEKYAEYGFVFEVDEDFKDRVLVTSTYNEEGKQEQTQEYFTFDQGSYRSLFLFDDDKLNSAEAKRMDDWMRGRAFKTEDTKTLQNVFAEGRTREQRIEQADKEIRLQHTHKATRDFIDTNRDTLPNKRSNLDENNLSEELINIADKYWDGDEKAMLDFMYSSRAQMYNQKLDKITNADNEKYLRGTKKEEKGLQATFYVEETKPEMSRKQDIENGLTSLAIQKWQKENKGVEFDQEKHGSEVMPILEDLRNQYNDLIDDPSRREEFLNSDIYKSIMDSSAGSLRSEDIQKNIRDYAENQDGNVFFKGTSQKISGEAAEKEFNALQEKSKKLLQEQTAFEESITNSDKKLKETLKWFEDNDIAAQIKEIRSKKYTTQQEADAAQNKIETLQNTYNSKVKEYNDAKFEMEQSVIAAKTLHRDFVDVIEDREDFEEISKYLNQNYQWGTLTIKALGDASVDLIQALGTAIEVVYNLPGLANREFARTLLDYSEKNPDSAVGSFVNFPGVRTGLQSVEIVSDKFTNSRFDDDPNTRSLPQKLHDAIDDFQESNIMNVADPLAFGDIDGFGDFGKWTAHMLGSQAPQLALLVATGGSSMLTQSAILTASAAGGKFSDMEEQRDLYLQTGGLYGKDYSFGNMILSSTAVGLAEALSERVTIGQLKNVSKGLRKANLELLEQTAKGVKRGFNKEFVRGYTSHMMNTVFNPKLMLAAGYDRLEEGVSESLATMSENLIDIYNGEDVSIFDNVDQAFVSGAIMSQAISSPIVFNHMAAPFRSVNTQSILNNNTARMEKLLRDIHLYQNDPAKEKELIEEYKELKEESMRVMELDVKRVDVMTEFEKGKLIEVHKNSRRLIREASDLQKKLDDKSITQEQYTRQYKDLENQFNRINSQKQQILDKYDVNFINTTYEKTMNSMQQRAQEISDASGGSININIQEGNDGDLVQWQIENGGYTVVESDADGNPTRITMKENTRKGKIKEFKNQLNDPNLTNKERSIIESNLKVLESGVDVGMDINQYNQIMNNSSNFGAFVPKYDNDGNYIGQEIFINKTAAHDGGEFSIAAHEFMHGMLYSTLKGDMRTQNALTNTILDTLKQKGVKIPEAIMNKINSYAQDGTRGEEIMAVLSQAISDGDIKLPKTALGGIKNFFRRYGYNHQGAAIEFDTDQDVINFLKDYNYSMNNNKQNKALTNMFIHGASGKLIEKQQRYRDLRKKYRENATERNNQAMFSKNVDQVIKSQPDLMSEIDSFVKNPDGTPKYKTQNEFINSIDGGEAYNLITNTKKLDGLIQAGIMAQGINTPQAIGEFTRNVKDKLGERLLKNFDPAKNDSLFGWLTGVSGGAGQSIIYRAKGDVMVDYKKQLQTTSADVGVRTDTGETIGTQFEADVDTDVQAFENEIIIPGSNVRVNKNQTDVVFLESINAKVTQSKVNLVVENAGVNLQGLTYNGTKKMLVQHDGGKPKSKRKPTGPLYGALQSTSNLFGVDPLRIVKEQDLTATQRELARDFIKENTQQLIDMLPEGENRSGDATGVANTVLKEFYVEGERISMAESGSAKGKKRQTKRDNITTQEFVEFFNKPGTKSDGAIRALIVQAATISTNQAIRLNALNKSTDTISTIALVGDGKSAVMFSKKQIPSLKDKVKPVVQGIGKITRNLNTNDTSYFYDNIVNFASQKMVDTNIDSIRIALTNTYGDNVGIMSNIDQISKSIHDLVKQFKPKVINNPIELGAKLVETDMKVDVLVKESSNSPITNAEAYRDEKRRNKLIALNQVFVNKIFDSNNIENSLAKILILKSHLASASTNPNSSKAWFKVSQILKGNVDFIPEIVGSIPGIKVNTAKSKSGAISIKSIEYKNPNDPNAETVVVKPENISTSQKSSDALKDVEAFENGDSTRLNTRDANENTAQDLLNDYVAFWSDMFKKGDIDNTDLMMVKSGLLAGMNTILARAGKLAYISDKARALIKKDGDKAKVRYEHMPPRVQMINDMFNKYINGNGIPNARDYFKEFKIQIITQQFDKVIGEAKLGSSLLEGTNVNTPDVGIARNYNDKTMGDPRVESIRDVRTGQLVVPSEAHVRVTELLNKQRKQSMMFSKAVNNANAINENTPSRGASIFDFDETLIDKGENTIIATKGDDVVEISSGNWPLQGPQYAADGYTFDFSDFINVKGGVEGPLMQKFRNRIAKYGIENNYILTARPAEAAPAIKSWLETKGIDMPIENITGLGNSTGEAKALWIAEKYSEGYNDMYFVDDALPNVDAVKDMMDQLDIKGKSVQAKIKFSKRIKSEFSDIINKAAQQEIDLDFNRILEQTKGVKAESRFSDAQAKVRGSKKGKYAFFVPPSAEDFKGLIYRFLSKGKVGEQQMAFFKKALFDPFARATTSIDIQKQKIQNEYRQLLKQFPDVKADLNRVIYNNFTLGQMIRVYNWNKAGFEIPGLSQRDLNNIVKEMEADAEALAFANSLSIITNQNDGYVEPGEFWLVENIQSDLNKITNEINRDLHLQEFKQNREKIFGEWQGDRLVGPNMNKIEAIYGTNFREALEDILYRMEYGTKRNKGNNRLVNAFNNWANQSVGAIMFFNMRSALLQTISSVNYLNWSDNNPLKAGLALANFPQFLKDFSMIFNSDMLKQRRAGNQRGINEAELAQAVGGVGVANRVKAMLNWLLTKGFLPTQIADSFAIASGGATFFRNRVNSYVKQGYTQTEAETKAFQDFQEITEESQQSSRPDMISQQQASPLGRYILAFKNTPMQYARLMKRAYLDLVNGRGDYKTNVGKIIYYGGIQNLIFNGLQAALGALIGDDEEEDKKTGDHIRIANSMIDSILGGIGFGGNAVMTVKNAILEYNKQNNKKWNSDHTYTMLKLVGFSPTVGSKLRKVYSSIQTEKFNKDVIGEMSMLDIDNPRWSAIANLVSAATNIPLDRLVKKMDNIDAALTEDISNMERFALLMGWNTWDLGIEDQDIIAVEKEIKEKKQIEIKEKREKKKEEDKRKKEEENKSVIEKNIKDQKKKKEDGAKEVQCAAITKSGKRCSNMALPGQNFCTVHQKVEKQDKEVQCSKIKSDGERCKMKTKNKSGLCYYHD